MTNRHDSRATEPGGPAVHRRFRRVLLGAAGMALIAGAVGAPTDAQASSVGRLSPSRTTLTWHGGPFSGLAGLPGFSNPIPLVCVINCERRSLAIDFPASTWVRPRDGVLIAIKHADPQDAINLFVYGPDGKRLGASNGLDSDGQAVFLPHPANGRYTIVVNVTELANADVTYEGRAWVRPDPCTEGNCRLLPLLMPKPPFNLHVTGLPLAPSTFAGFPLPIPPGPATPRSCWLDETLAQGARRCLRFSSEIDNLGMGALVLRFRLLQPLTDPGLDLQHEYLTGCRMQQVVEFEDGTTSSADAGPCVFHLPHGHFHYENMATFSLHAVKADGSTGGTLRESNKQGFCLTDGRVHGYGTNSFDGRHYWFPNCNLPSAIDGSTWVRMGISPGWGDVYTWDVPAQYVDITRIADGVYDVVSVTNPLGQLREADGHTRGSAQTRICLRGDTVIELSATATACP